MPDIFICHATEDKESIVRPLARSLSAAGLDIWYDEYSLKLGDSLRRSIDQGLAESRFGVVILSPAFFEKDWPQTELDGLFAKEIGQEKTILPVWHDIEHTDVLMHSPLLADRIAIKTIEGLDNVIMKILEVVAPNASHLTSEGSTVGVSPSFIRLHTGEWAVKTPLRITNYGDQPVHSVQIKLELDPSDLDPQPIHLDLGYPTTRIEGAVSWASISPDAIRLYFENLSGNSCLSIILHTIAPGESREIQVEGKESIKSSATVELWDFKFTPPEVLRKGDQVAFPFSVPEDVKVKGLGILIKKRK